MSRPIAFDITHLASRLTVDHPSGIDKVDMAYAEWFSKRSGTVVHYGLARPRFHDLVLVEEVLAAATRSRWTSPEALEDQVYNRAYFAITGRAAALSSADGTPPKAVPLDAWRRRLLQIRCRLSPGPKALPDRSIYLNVAQLVFEYPLFLRWLDQRRDVLPVFLVHDLLPLDFPEYFRPGYRNLFLRRAATIVHHAGGLITTTRAVQERLEQHFKANGRPMVPLHVEPLPSSLPDVGGAELDDSILASIPYFVVLGTIEPRKNHLLLLNIWRRMAQEMPNPPKLVIVGSRGWENEQVLDILERSTLVRPHIVECCGLGDRGLVKLLRNARALLMPSFAEGYGLPVVEALSVGTTVVASDIPVFREIAQGRAILRHPLDGPGWREAIEQLCDPNSVLTKRTRLDNHEFKAPTWAGYFAGIEGFLATL